MAATLLLDRTQWDILLDASGNIALATEPYSLAQDAASAIRTFLGECYWDTTVGVPWLTQIFGQPASQSLLKARLIAAAETVPDVASAEVFFLALNNRILTGQVQVRSTTTQQISVATFNMPAFSTIDPQGP